MYANVWICNFSVLTLDYEQQATELLYFASFVTLDLNVRYEIQQDHIGHSYT